MKKCAALVLIILIVFININLVHADDNTGSIINAPAYMLFDPATGQVLAEKNADARMYPASTTKIMAAIVSIEHGNPNQLMTASVKAIDPGEGGMNIGIMQGEQLRMIDLLNALLVKSANEAANIMGENIFSSTDAMVAAMNSKAKEIGATNTHYVTTNGMHDPNHYTTVRDMVKITTYALKIPLFKEIVARSQYDMPVTNKHAIWNTLYTSNKLFSYKSDYYTKVTGIKTGYTGEAGHNLISSAIDKNGTELAAIVFGVQSIDNASNVFVLSKKLLEYGFQHYAYQQVVDSNASVSKVKVTDAKGGNELNLVTANSLSSILPLDKDNWNIEKEIQYANEKISAPIKKDDIIGTVQYKSNGTIIGKVNLLAAENIEKSSGNALSQKLGSLVGNQTFLRVLAISASIVLCFALIRFILRRMSRKLNARRQ